MRDKARLRNVESVLKSRFLNSVEIFNDCVECGEIETALQIRAILFELRVVISCLGYIDIREGTEVFDSRYEWLLPYDEVRYNNKTIYKRKWYL